jgi:hypothetical protein
MADRYNTDLIDRLTLLLSGAEAVFSLVAVDVYDNGKQPQADGFWAALELLRQAKKTLDAADQGAS